MILFKGHQNIRVRRTDGAGGALDVINRAVRQTDVVQNIVQFLGRNDTADRVFHEIGKPRGFFNTCAGLGAKMEDKLAAVGIRKKIFTEPGDQPPGGKTEQ